MDCDALGISLKNDSFFINMHELLQNIIMYGIVRRGFGGRMSQRLCHKKQHTQRVEEIGRGKMLMVNQHYEHFNVSTILTALQQEFSATADYCTLRDQL